VTPYSGIRRIIWTTVLCALSAIGLLWPAIFAHLDSSAGDVDRQSVITDYTAHYRVDADGRMYASEQLTIDMAAGKHGIFRFFPIADRTDPHARTIPTVTKVTVDGQPGEVGYEWRNNGAFYVARIGNPNVTVAPGPHVYVIDYNINGGLVPPSAGEGQFITRAGTNASAPASAFYYDVVGFWAQPIVHATTTIDLPGPSGQVACVASAAGEIPCTIDGAGTAHLTVAAANLPAQNPVTVRADLSVPAPPRATVGWTVEFDYVLGHSVPMTVLVAVLTLLAAGAGLWLFRMQREIPPGTPVLYVPPQGLGPAQTRYIADETEGDDAMVATLLSLADRKLIRLDRSDSRHWTVTGIGTPEQWAAIDPVGRALGTALGVTTPGAAFAVDGAVSTGQTLIRARKTVANACRSWSEDTGVMQTSWSGLIGRVLLLLSAVAAVIGFVGFLAPTMWGAPFAAFTICGFGLLATGATTRRTPAGRELWSRAAGFRRLLATPSSEDRFDYAARQDLYIAYIPYAVAFGVADKWAAKYRAATNTEPPVPWWYPVPVGQSAGLYSAGNFSDGLASFNSAVSSSISAYTASQSSSSSSSGGGGWSSGGGSWGGGGGGGGGTW